VCCLDLVWSSLLETLSKRGGELGMGVKMVSLFLLSLLLFPMREGAKGGAILPLLLLLMGRGGEKGEIPSSLPLLMGGRGGKGEIPSPLLLLMRGGREGGVDPLLFLRGGGPPPPPPLGPTGPGPAQRNFFFGCYIVVIT
jgi:hypothetical protein